MAVIIFCASQCTIKQHTVAEKSHVMCLVENSDGYPAVVLSSPAVLALAGAGSAVHSTGRRGHLLRSNPERGGEAKLPRGGAVLLENAARAAARSVQHMDLCALLFRLDQKALLR